MESFLKWGEKYIFHPKGIDYFIALILSPISLAYTLLLFIRYILIRPVGYGIPIISIGNRVVGGSGKTPFTIAIAKRYSKVAIILRGYKRHSKGTIIVQDNNTLLVSISQSGDEAMLLAQELPHATIIVAEDRIDAIKRAKELGCEVLFLDDAYSKHFIQKMDILLEELHPTYLPFCLPSGALRECLWWGKEALQVYENRDFFRVVHTSNATKRMVLITAISKPWRLDAYLPEVVAKEYFLDHHAFTKEELEMLMLQHNATSILTTQKDSVKMENFNLPLSIMHLSLDINENIVEKIDSYIRTF